MKKIIGGIFIILILTINFIKITTAVPPSKNVEFKNTATGKVIFSGKSHANVGLKCKDCHPKVFIMKKGANKITMEKMYAGKYCGKCHNGNNAFDIRTNCKKCHK